jgi:uncharacterized protein (DUF488 family)
MTIFTIGHSTRTTAELIDLLREAGVDLLVDVRSVPRSRTNPQFNTDTLPQALAAAGIGYRHIRALGGLRHDPKGAPQSPNTLWRNDAFRNYADYAMTEPFRAGLAELRALADEHRCAIMCAEAVWWRCHRRLVADYLLAEGIPVGHIMGRAGAADAGRAAAAGRQDRLCRRDDRHPPLAKSAMPPAALSPASGGGCASRRPESGNRGSRACRRS